MASPPTIDLDANATTPALPEVVDAMVRVMRSAAANPSSLHAGGRAARALLETSRETVSGAVGGGGGDLHFTSGGSEANALALLCALGAARARDGRRPHAAVCATEHPSTLEVAQRLQKHGVASVTTVRPGGDGRVEPAAIETALGGDTVLVSLHLANNETGVLQDVATVGRLCRERGVLLHCDAVQALGKVPLDLGELGADLVTLSAHKVHGPAGIGALWVRRGVRVSHPFGGGPQERGVRPGTENVAAAVGFAAALEHLELCRPEARDRLWEVLVESTPGALRNGSAERVVPNTLNVSFPGVRAETLLIRLDMQGVRASSGSACSSGAREPSHVLRAMGMSEARVESAVRLSFARGATVEDGERAGAIVARCVVELLGAGSRG